MNLVRMAESRSPEGQQSGIAQAPYHTAKERVLDVFTRTYVTEALKASRGNISEAARTSGLERVSLQKIIKRLELDPEAYR